MALRKGHGAGQGVPRIEVLPPDELPSVSLPFTVRADRMPDGRFAVGNAVQRSRVVRPGAKGHTSALTADETFAPFQRWGRRYASHRREELASVHGGELSAGVSALIESAGEQLAASRYLHAKASATGDATLFKQSSALANDARQNELAAWELASREAAARPRRRPPPPPPRRPAEPERLARDDPRFVEAKRIAKELGIATRQDQDENTQ
jgi:hypothetical protein